MLSELLIPKAFEGSKQSKMKNIYHSVEYFFYFLKSLGLASYQFDKKSESFKTSFGNYLQLSAAIIIWILLLALQFIDLDEFEYETGVQSSLLEQIWRNLYILKHFLAIFVIIYNFMKRKNVENFLKLIAEFDQTVERLNWKFKVTQFNLLMFAMFVIPAFTIFLYLIVSMYGFEVYGNISINYAVAILRTSDYIILTEFYLMLSLQFILSSYCIKKRLTTMITNLR